MCRLRRDVSFTEIVSIESALRSASRGYQESHCPYCDSLMKGAECPRCGTICQRCGTPSKEPRCPQCGLGGPVQGFTETSSLAPAQSPEFSDVQQILRRTPSRREYNMFRGMIDRDKERTHRLVELLCENLPTPLNRELIELRALQVRSRAIKGGTELTHAESALYSFLEAAKQTGALELATMAVAEAQLLDSNLSLGLSKARLPPLEFLTEVSGEEETEPSLLVDEKPRSCKKVLMETRPHGRTYLIVWRPFLADCLENGSESRAKRISARLESSSGPVMLTIARKDTPMDKRWHIHVQLDMRRCFYGFTMRKEVEVDLGLPAWGTADPADLALRRLAKQLDSLGTTCLFFGLSGAGSPSVALWSQARSILNQLSNPEFSVTPRRKAAASILAADMKRFAGLEPMMKADVVLSSQAVPLSPQDAEYVLTNGLIVPSEFSPVVGMGWNDLLSLALKM